MHADRPVSAASSSVISKLDFTLRPKNSAQDLLRLVPGLFIAQHAGGGKAEQIFVRGFDCDHGTDCALFVDGIPINMPSHGHGQGFADSHFIIPETIENMEVYKGPYFAQFGDFATGAAVEFNTVQSLDHNSVEYDISSVPSRRAYDGSRLLAMLELPTNKSNLQSYVAGDFLFKQGYFDVPQDFARFILFSKTTYELNDHASLSFSFNGFSSSWNASGQIPTRAVKEGIIDRFGSIDTTEGGTTSRNQINLVYKSGSANQNFETQFFAGNYRFKLFSDFTFFLNDPVHGDEIEQDDTRNFLGFNSKYTFPIDTKTGLLKMTFGFGARIDNLQNQLWHCEARQRLNVEANANVFEKNFYGYAEAEWHPNPLWRFDLSIRENYFVFDVEDLIPTDSAHKNYSGYNYQFLPTPKFNIAFYPAENLSLFFNSGLGFHSNDARAVVQDSTSSMHLLPRALGAEFGAQYHPVPWSLISIAFWGMDLSDELTYDGDNGTTEDDGPTRRIGIDFSLRLQPVKWLTIDDDINLAKGRLLKDFLGSELPNDNFIPLAPTFTSTGGVTTHIHEHWDASLRYRYMHDRPANEDNSIVALGYLVFDAAFAYHVSSWSAQLTIENLTNTEWNEAEFETTSRLYNEPAPVDELNFTPGTPFALKLSFAKNF